MRIHGIDGNFVLLGSILIPEKYSVNSVPDSRIGGIDGIAVCSEYTE